jgi:hypothetical protein
LEREKSGSETAILEHALMTAVTTSVERAKHLIEACHQR